MNEKLDNKTAKRFFSTMGYSKYIKNGKFDVKSFESMLRKRLDYVGKTDKKRLTNEFTEKLMNQFTKELDLNTRDYIKKGEYWYLDKIDREKFLSDVINQVTELSKMYNNESVNETVSNIKMNNLDWGKSTAERNANLDKYYSLKTNKERRDFLIKLKGESVNEDEQLDEKLITFSNRAPYGQIVFMAGGAGSGKGFAINNFIDAAGFKVRDVDEMKKAVGKLDALGKISVDKWYKKYYK